MKIVKLLRMGALLAAAIAFVGCEMTLSDEDSRKEVVEAKAKANAASGSGSGGGSTGTVDGTYASYGTLVAGSWNTADGTIGALNGISETTGLTVSFHIDNAMTSTDQVVLFINSDATCGITNGYLWPWASANTKNIGVNDAWLGSSYGVIKEACVANSLYTVVFGTDGGVYFYVNGEMIGNGWCESVVTDSDAWAGVKNFNKTMVNAAAGGLKVLHDMASLNLTMDDFLYTKAMSKDEVKAMYDAWKKGKSPAPTTDNSSQGENTGTNNSGNNGNNNSGNTENNNNSGNSGNGQSGESGTGTTVTVENLTSARTFSATETDGYTVKLGCDNSSMKVTSVKYNESELMPANTAYTLTNLSFNGVNVGGLSADTWTVEYTYSMTAVGSSAWTDYNFEIADGNTTDGALGYWSLRYDNYAVGYLKGYHEYGEWTKEHVDGVASGTPAYGGHWYGMTNNLGELNHSQSLNKTLVMKVQKTADAFVITIKSDGTEVWKCVNEKVSQ